MIEVTKINGSKVLINPDLMELVEETPDTVITFTTGRKIIVKESRQEVKNLVNCIERIFLQINAKMGVSCGFSVDFGLAFMLWYVLLRHSYECRS